MRKMKLLGYASAWVGFFALGFSLASPAADSEPPTPIAAVDAAQAEQVIHITARRYRFEPNAITLHKGVPVILELQSPETTMSFNAPDFLISEELPPGKVVRVRLTPDKTGEFLFVCDIYCGSGHEKMRGAIKVE
jgi:cytochrome c oxidase subunit 2